MRMVRFTSRFWTAAALTMFVLAFGFLGPIIFGGNPNQSVGGQYDPPSGSAWLGTDDIGRDVFTNLMHGVQTSLTIGLVAGLVAIAIGVLFGLVAGYRGGVVEEALMGFTNVVLAIPAIVLLILLSVALDQRSVVVLAFVIGITSWPWTARAVRAQASSVRTREHLDVARLSGAGTSGILVLDVLPYLLSYIAMAFVLQVSSAILAEAGLSLLGLGPSEGVSLGLMLQWALVGEAVRSAAWWAFIPPTLMLTLVAFGLLMLQSSLDEVFNPRLRRGTEAKPESAPLAPSAAVAAPVAAVAADVVASEDVDPTSMGDGSTGPGSARERER